MKSLFIINLKYILTGFVLILSGLSLSNAQHVLSVSNVNGKHEGLLNSSILVKTTGFKQTEGRHVILYVNGIPLENIQSKMVSSTNFVFDLDPEELIRFYDRSQSRDMLVSIGESGKKPLLSDIKYNFQFYDQTAIWISLFVVVIIGLISVKVLEKSAMLKDQNNKYSLSIMIMFFWTIIIVYSVVFFSIATLSSPSINQTILLLLGISGAMAAGSATISKPLNNPLVSTSVLTSGSSTKVQIHRFQNVVFNLVYGLFFLNEVIFKFRFPEFDTNTLLLLGISGGTYLGLKVSEQNIT